MSPPLIYLEKVSFIYHPGTSLARQALQEVSLEVKSGEGVGIVGGTGSGKTTLAMHFNGLLRPQRGKVYIEGKELTYTPAELAHLRKKVGLLFQYPEHQLFGRTVWEDISFVLTRRPELPLTEIKERVRAACAAVGMEDENFWSRSPWELSRGEMRRVALAGILVQDPGILILDEPTVGLDGPGKKEILHIINSLHKAGRTVIIITHDVEEILEIVEKLIVLDHGRILMAGAPDQVFADLWGDKNFAFLVPPLYQLSLELSAKGWVLPRGRIEEVIAHWHLARQRGKINLKGKEKEN